MERNHITQQQIESYLWGAAALLRGTIDEGDYKQFILHLPFYKHICNIFDEDPKTALREYGKEGLIMFPKTQGFQLPEDYLWKCLRTKSTNISHAFQKAIRCIDLFNPDKMDDTLGDVPWTNKGCLPASLLKNLTLAFIPRINLFLQGAEDFHIECGHALRLSAFYSVDNLGSFECVIVNPSQATRADEDRQKELQKSEGRLL